MSQLPRISKLPLQRACYRHLRGGKIDLGVLVPDLPLKLRLNVRTDTAPVEGACPMPMHGPQARLQDPRTGRDDVLESAVPRQAFPDLARAGCNGEAHVRVDLLCP